MKARILVLVCSILLSTRLSAQQTTTQWLTHTDTTFHFTVSYPNDWEFKLPGTSTRFFVTSYLENDADDFRENINCVAKDLSQKDFSVRSAEDAIMQSLKEKMTNFQLTASGYIKWNNADALQIEYTFSKTIDEKSYLLHMYQQIACVNGTLYTLTYTATKEKYSKYFAVVKKVFQSLKTN